MSSTPPRDDLPQVAFPQSQPPEVLPAQAEVDAKGLFLDSSIPLHGDSVPRWAAEEGNFRSPSRLQRWALPAVLFFTTCLSTFWAGSTKWLPQFDIENLQQVRSVIQANWRDGLLYMAAVMAILLMHEMGHFVQTLRYHVPASLPLFLPLPVLMGTMGAVIVMDPSRANRKQLFDIGLSGPWAGLVVAIPLIWYGIKTATPDTGTGDFIFGTPLVFKLITAYARPELASSAVMKNPFFMAGWVGMLVTGLNMLPVSQLDGGHVIYGLFGHNAKWVARAFIIAAIAFIIVTEQYNWIVMLILVLLLGVDHPPTGDDSVRLGPVRWTIGLVSLLIPVFCFTPVINPAS